MNTLENERRYDQSISKFKLGPLKGLSSTTFNKLFFDRILIPINKCLDFVSNVSHLIRLQIYGNPSNLSDSFMTKEMMNKLFTTKNIDIFKNIDSIINVNNLHLNKSNGNTIYGKKEWSELLNFIKFHQLKSQDKNYVNLNKHSTPSLNDVNKAKNFIKSIIFIRSNDLNMKDKALLYDTLEILEKIV